MADNFENYKESFEYITESLDSIRAQNAMNAGSTDKILVAINNKLGEIASEDNTDLIKLFLAELKKSLEERHTFVSSKFSEIESSVQELSKKSETQLQASEIKELFEIIATNLGVFSKDFSSQKDLINEIMVKFEEFSQDESQKKDILRNISVLKVELEKFNNGLESISINLRDNFVEVAQILSKMDPAEDLQGLKKDIENVFLSSNAVLSTLQVIDRKNRELEEVITHVVTKEEFNVEREQVAKLIAQNMEFANVLSQLPKKTEVEALAQRLDTSVGVINALKNMLAETGKQNQEILTAQLNNLEAKILNISSEEEFLGFRNELAEFSKEVTKSTNAMRADLADVNADLKILNEFLLSVDIKERFDNFAAATKISESNLQESISVSAADISKEIAKNRSITKTDINDSEKKLFAKIDESKAELEEGSKSNLASIIEHIQSVVNSIFSAKNALHIENAENTETIENRIDELKENLASASNYMVQNAQNNLENIISNVEKVFTEVSELKTGVSEDNEAQSKNVNSGFSQISKKIGEIKEELNQNSQENFSNLLSIVEDFSVQIQAVKESLKENFDENSQEVKVFLENLTEKLYVLKNDFSQISQENSSMLKESINGVYQGLKETKLSLEQFSSTGFSGIKTNIEELFSALSTFEERFEIKSQSNLSKIISVVGDLSSDFDSYKDSLSEAAKAGFEEISVYIKNLGHSIEEENTEFREELKSNIYDLQETVLALPDTIKENQAFFENEKRVLIEENSRSIEEAGNKIQNLIKGLAAKDNPFKGEVLFEFSSLKANLETLKEDLIKANIQTEEEINKEIQRILEAVEESISTKSEGYFSSLAALQEKLGEYFDQIQQSEEENEVRLSNAIKESREIRKEIENISAGFSQIAKTSNLEEISVQVNDKFADILQNLGDLENIFETKSQNNVQNILSVLEDRFCAVSSELASYKNYTTGQIGEFIEEAAEKTELVKNQINLIGTDILTSLEEKSKETLNLITSVSQAVAKLSEIDLETALTEEIENSSQSVKDALTCKIIQTGEDTKKAVLEGVKAFQEESETSLADKIASLNSEIKLAFSHEFAEQTEQNKADIIDEIKQSQETIENTMLNEFEENINFIKGVLESISPDKELNQVLLQKAENLHATVISSAKGIEGQVSSAVADFKTSTQSAMNELQSSFYEKVDDSIDDLRSFLEILNDKNDISPAIAEIKSEIADKILDAEASIEESIRSISVKKDLDELNKDIQNALHEILDSVNEKLHSVLENNSSIVDISQKSEEITRRVEELKRIVSDELSEKIAHIEMSFDGQKQDISKMHDELKSSISELKENYVDLSLNSTMEMSGLLVTLDEKLSNIETLINTGLDFSQVIEKTGERFNKVEEKLNSLDFSQVINELGEKFETSLNNLNISEEFENSQNEIKESLSNNFEIINQKLDVFINEPDSELKESIDEIKNVLNNHSKLLDKLQILPSTLPGKDLKEEIMSSLESFGEKIDALSSMKFVEEVLEKEVDSEEKGFEFVEACETEEEVPESFEEVHFTAQPPVYAEAGFDIKAELNNLKEELVGNFVEIFTQISFIVEAEDIKDFIQEKTDEIKSEIKANLKNGFGSINVSGEDLDIRETVKEALGNNFDDILSSLDILHEKAGSVDYSCSAIAEEIQDVKQQIKTMASSLDIDSDYTYTLQDVESDIAKLRLILKDISEEKGSAESNTGLDKINEDLLSLSTRTNKLLLNSDESSNVLKENLSEFRNIIYQLEERVKYLDNSETLSRIEKRIEEVNGLALSSVKSDKIFNQTFMYLAEWIDKADEKLLKIEEKFTEIDSVNKNMVKLSDVELLFEKFFKRFDKQEAKITALEEKIEKLSKVPVAKETKASDLRTLVKEVLSQSAKADVKPDAKLSKKVDNIDKQLASLGKSIEKITSYVD